MKGERALLWQKAREEDLRVRRSANRPPIAASLPPIVDVAAIRLSLPRLRCQPVTQAQFASRFGFGAAAVRDWEQHRRQPDAAARVLLTLIAHDAAGVEAALAAAIEGKAEAAPGEAA